MKAWKKIALGMLLGKALLVSVLLTPWIVSPDPDRQIKSEEETETMSKDREYITLTEENFQTQVLENARPVLVDFWADWCRPCHAMAPVIEQVAIDFEGRAKVGKLDIDENASIPMEYGSSFCIPASSEGPSAITSPTSTPPSLAPKERSRAGA